MVHTIDVTPEGIKTEEGQNRVKEAMAAKDAAAWEAVRQLRELLRTVNYHSGIQQLAAIVTEWYGDEETAKGLIEDCFTAIKAVDETNEEFLKAIAGR